MFGYGHQSVFCVRAQSRTMGRGEEINKAVFGVVKRFWIWLMCRDASCCLFVGAVVIISALTICAVLRQQPADHTSSLLQALVEVHGVIFAVFFALVVFPLQLRAEIYSPIVIEAVRRDMQLWLSLTWLGLNLVYDLLFLLVPAPPAVEWLAFLGLIVSLMVVVLLVHHILQIVDTSFLIRKKASEIEAWLGREFGKVTETTAAEITARLESEAPEIVPGTPVLRWFRVPSVVTQELVRRVKPLVEITSSALQRGQVEEAIAGVRAIGHIGAAYAEARRDFSVDFDYFFEWLTSRMLELLRGASGVPSTGFQTALAEASTTIAVTAARIGRNPLQPYNLIVRWPESVLERIVLATAVDELSAAPATACNGLGAIGVELVRVGASTSAVSTARTLSQVARGTMNDSLWWLSQRAISGIASILHVGLGKDGVSSEDNYFLGEMVERMDEILDHYFNLEKPSLEVSWALNPLLSADSPGNLAHSLAVGIRSGVVGRESVSEPHDFVSRLTYSLATRALKGMQPQDRIVTRDLVGQLYEIGFTLEWAWVVEREDDMRKRMQSAFESVLEGLWYITGSSLLAEALESRFVANDTAFVLFSLLGLAVSDILDGRLDSIQYPAKETVNAMIQFAKERLEEGEGQGSLLLFKYLRLLGVWLLMLGLEDEAERLACLAAKGDQVLEYDFWLGGSRYPDERWLGPDWYIWYRPRLDVEGRLAATRETLWGEAEGIAEFERLTREAAAGKEETND